ncbi:F0F1 ATP synthase subunit B [bacterium]|nr:F0F1 ATP synthase subunit B [bacterium]
MELIKNLGISWPTLISQLINFAILYFLLKKFALTGLLEAITDRQKEIESGLTKAKQADDSLAKAKQQEDEILGAARVKAQEIIAQARETGRQQEESLVQGAKQQAASIVAAGESQVNAQKAKMMLEVKAELAGIIADGVRSVVGHSVSAAEVKRDYLDSGMKA